MQELTEDECYALLSETTTVGRLAFVHEGRQELLPVNFVVVDRVIHVRTARDSVIAPLAAGRDEVAFEVDHHDDIIGRGWSVVAVGSTRAVDELPPPAQGRAPVAQPWAAGTREVLIALEPRRISGRRVRRAR